MSQEKRKLSRPFASTPLPAPETLIDLGTRNALAPEECAAGSAQRPDGTNDVDRLWRVSDLKVGVAGARGSAPSRAIH